MSYQQKVFRGILIGVLFFICAATYAQTAYFFQDSNSPGYYDTGLAFTAGASLIDKSGPNGDKLPTEIGQKAFQGDNSLRFTWTSKPGGDWLGLIIAPGFPFQNLSLLDTLSFWVYADSGLTQGNMPKLYFEGAPGTTKSNRYPLGLFSDDIPVGSWTEVKIPLDTIFTDPNQTNINFSLTKAVILGQNAADNQSHTLYIDDVKAYRGVTASLPVATPLAFQAQGYECHVRLTWKPNTETHLGGYFIYQSIDSGATYQLRKYVSAQDSAYSDFTGHQGKNLDLKYQIAAVNVAGHPSPVSAPVDVSTFDMTDEELMTMVQEATFRYFWDFAHPVSGLSRERNTSDDLVTSGGSGFGIMAILVGIERGFISRAAGRDRINKILSFLKKADRFHGAWSHWLSGSGGTVIPFGPLDDGGDLVETSFMIQGLLCARTYFDQNDPGEDSLRLHATELWQAVDWNWYRKLTNNVLYWHWSPANGWQINQQLRGFNEVMITYILGIASPSHPIPPSLYHTGWAGNANYVNGNSYYGYPLAVGKAYGGPLFFAHYSYLGFDPRGIKDMYANYFVRNQNHSLIQWEYSIRNPKGFAGYDSSCWGLTASDDPGGYLAHEPNSNSDNGTISPTAALGSMPYTPIQSMAALRYFYRELGDKIWGDMGFYDAFNSSQNWYARSYLAIDQGPIMIMIENHRTSLLWDLFMQNPEIQAALDTLGFVEDTSPADELAEASPFQLQFGPNPADEQISLSLETFRPQAIEIFLLNSLGEKVLAITERAYMPTGAYQFHAKVEELPAGLYFLKMESSYETIIQKLIIY